jgi:hypothetical protein
MTRHPAYEPWGWWCWLSVYLWSFSLLCIPNEYEVTLGINVLDCQGPFETYLFAAPTLLVYGVGVIINGAQWRTGSNAVWPFVLDHLRGCCR